MVYTIIENQLLINGNWNLLYWHYEDENQAFAKFYTVLAAAAVSEIPYHAGFMFDTAGNMVDRKVFDRRTTEEQTNE